MHTLPTIFHNGFKDLWREIPHPHNLTAYEGIQWVKDACMHAYSQHLIRSHRKPAISSGGSIIVDACKLEAARNNSPQTTNNQCSSFKLSI
jgi:hypothetical protein